MFRSRLLMQHQLYFFLCTPGRMTVVQVPEPATLLFDDRYGALFSWRRGWMLHRLVSEGA